MSITDYEKAKRLGDKAVRADMLKGQHPYLPVLDDIIQKEEIIGETNLGLVNIPLERVVGTSTASRTNAFARNFMPIMDINTEFGAKWSMLCDAHIAEGIHDAIKVYEFMNYFYVVEGNKRVSVLKYFNADSIPAFVTRKIPKLSDRKDIKIYYEFMDFYKKTGVNYIWFSNEGSFAKLITEVGVDRSEESISTSTATSSNADSADGSGAVTRAEFGKVWSDEKTLEFKAAYYRFASAFKEQKGDKLLHITTGDAFLGMIGIKGFDAVAELSQEAMKQGIKEMWQEFLVMEEQFEVEVSLNPPEAKRSIISHILPQQYSAAKPLKIAFIYDREPDSSDWLYAHELGRNHIKEVFGDRISTLKITTAKTEQDAIDAMEELIEKQGVEVIFTTTTRLIDASLKCAIKYKNVKILNCSLNTSHRYIRTYYARLYEVKFLSGVIAGALTETNKVGYVADYPIFGNVANINAFALGAVMVNPRCKVYLKWTTLKDNHNIEDIYKSLEDEGVDYISDQDMITPNNASRRCGLYKLTDGEPVNMAMPVYNWGVLYEKLIDLILHDSWATADSNTEGKPINYWWGLSSGVVDLIISKKLPMQVARLVHTLKVMMRTNRFVAFDGGISSQDGRFQSEPDQELDIDDIIKMDWLCENVVGKIPSKEELRERARPIVELKGVKQEENEDTVTG